MFGVRFNRNNDMEIDSDLDSEVESESSPLIRVSTAASFKDGLHDRVLRSQQRKGKQEPMTEGLSEDQDASSDQDNESTPIEASGSNRNKSNAGARKRQSKTGKQRATGKRKDGAVAKISKKTATKKVSVALPKSYAANVKDLTHIPKDLIKSLPSIDWKDTMSCGDEKEGADILTPNFCNAIGVAGQGKGTEKGLPLYEFGSLWQYMIPSQDSKNPEPWKLDPAIPPPDVTLKILSVVSCVSLGIPLDLQTIAEKGYDLHYFPESFTPLVMRLKQPVATAMLFKSGKMVVTGTKSERDNGLAIAKITRRLQRMEIPARPLCCQIQNLTASCNLGFRIRVHLLAQIRGVSAQYHPELFTGVTITFTIPRAKAILFRTGSMLITGVKSEKEAELILQKVYPLAKMYAN